MGKLKSFEILLKNAQTVYYPGQTIEGTVSAELNEEIQIRELRILCDGEARVKWKEHRSTGTSSYTKTYLNKEKYFNNVVVLFGKEPNSSGDNPKLGPGHFTYPFKFELPQGIPSSYESEIGRVRYTLTAVFDIPWRFDKKTKCAFTVANLLDLNKEPTAPQSIQNTGHKSLCCLCCKSGPISATVRLNRTGYVPGESITINAEIDNKSSRAMDKSFVELEMVVRYHAKSKTKKKKTIICELQHGPISAGDGDVWNGDKLVLPPIPPSRLDGCSIIEINYVLKLNVDPSGAGLDLEVPVDVLIGSIPLKSVVEQYGMPSPPPTPAVTEGQQAPVIAPAPIVPPVPNLYPDIPPPTYTESMFGKVDIKEEKEDDYTRGDLQYAPQYAYYNWSQNQDQYASAFTYN